MHFIEDTPDAAQARYWLGTFEQRLAAEDDSFHRKS